MESTTGTSRLVKADAAAAARGAIKPRRSLLDDVYDRLIEMLLDTDFEPGTRLSIDALARAWDVSQTPVREALVRAEASGLVVRQAMKGYKIAPLMPAEDFLQLMEMRLLLEPFCASRAAERNDAELIAALERQHHAMTTAPTGPGPSGIQEYMRADSAFHEEVIAVAGNSFLQSTLASMSPHAHRFRRFSGRGVDDAPEALREHAQILSAIHAGDPRTAETAMREHLEGVTRRGLAQA